MKGYEGDTVYLGPRCSQCRGEMEEGFIPDHTHGAILRSHWVRGRPKKSIWTKISLRGQPRYRIITYRCLRCGFLALYAGG